MLLEIWAMDPICFRLLARFGPVESGRLWGHTGVMTRVYHVIAIGSHGLCNGVIPIYSQNSYTIVI